MKQWNPITDACEYCKECDYFLNEFPNCQGASTLCWCFIPKENSKYKNAILKSRDGTFWNISFEER